MNISKRVFDKGLSHQTKYNTFSKRRENRAHSGAGRIGKLRMRTMSLYESGDSSGKVSLKNLCEGDVPTTLTGEVNLYDLATYIVRGGFPGSLGLPIENARLISESYIETILTDDA